MRRGSGEAGAGEAGAGEGAGEAGAGEIGAMRSRRNRYCDLTDLCCA